MLLLNFKHNRIRETGKLFRIIVIHRALLTLKEAHPNGASTAIVTPHSNQSKRDARIPRAAGPRQLQHHPPVPTTAAELPCVTIPG